MFVTTAVALSVSAFLSAPVAAATNVAGAEITAEADQATRTVAAANPEAAAAAATVCGSGYQLLIAERLPTASNRLGTLFLYTDGGSGPDNWACAILDNNTASTKWMKLKLCENKADHPRCDADEGNFSQYAGPVYMDNCPSLTALMKNTSSSSSYLINAVRGSFCN